MGMIINISFSFKMQCHWFATKFQKMISILSNHRKLLVNTVMINMAKNSCRPKIWVDTGHTLSLLSIYRKT